MSDFGDELRRLREARGLTLHEVADAVRAAVPGSKSSHQQISQWERGTRRPRSRRAYQALDDYLGADGALMAAAGLAVTPPVVLPRLVPETMDTIAGEVRDLRGETAAMRAELDRQVTEYERLVALLELLLAREQEQSS